MRRSIAVIPEFSSLEDNGLTNTAVWAREENAVCRAYSGTGTTVAIWSQVNTLLARQREGCFPPDPRVTFLLIRSV